MIFVEKIALTQFRNYLWKEFSFTGNIIAISGPNGSGKTNLLDAVYMLCFTKSYFSKSDAQSVYPSLCGFRIEGQILKNNTPNHIVCILRENNRKEFQLNNETYKKFSDHIGKFPCVFISPDDVQLITEGGEVRRNFIDTLLSQLDHDYLQYLINYKKILDERNSFLKSSAERNYVDDELLNVYDEQLISNGEKIYRLRNEFLKTFLPVVKQEYIDIGGTDDRINLEFSSQLHNRSYRDLLIENRQRDLYIQRTACGVHRDDIDIQMGDIPFKNIASQGQRKSLLFALKLGEFRMLIEKKGFAPLLLLDDVFEKLDAARMHNLLYKVCIKEQAQVFITDTHKERLKMAFESLNTSYQSVEL